MIQSEKTEVNRHPDLWLRLVGSHSRFCETDEPEKRCHWFRFKAFAV